MNEQQTRLFMGVAHAAGEGAEWDMAAACMWFSLAAKSDPDDENIRQALSMARRDLSDAQIKEAEGRTKAKFEEIKQSTAR